MNPSSGKKSFGTSILFPEKGKSLNLWEKKDFGFN
jgi:hypothetical protein